MLTTGILSRNYKLEEHTLDSFENHIIINYVTSVK